MTNLCSIWGRNSKIITLCFDYVLIHDWRPVTAVCKIVSQWLSEISAYHNRFCDTASHPATYDDLELTIGHILV